MLVMHSVGKRIRQARVAAGLSVPELARACGLSRQAVYNWESDADQPTGPNLVAAAECLGVNERWLVSGKGMKRRNFGKSLELVTSPILDVPLISWVQAGQVGEAFDPYSPGAGEEYLPVPYHRESLIALRVQGQSMNKEAPEGSIIIVDFEDKVLKSGALYVFKTKDGDVSFKRYRAGPDRFEPASTEEHETIFPAPGWSVIGRVIQVVRRL